MVYNYKDGDFLLCRSNLTSKSLKKYPFRFVIQSGSSIEKFIRCSALFVVDTIKLNKPKWKWNEPYEHVAQYLNGHIYEASGKKGVIKTISEEWFRTRYDFLTIDIRRPTIAFTDNEIERMIFTWEINLGEKYNFLEAPLAVLGILIPKKFRKKSTSRSKFCSQICVKILQLIHRMPGSIIAKYVSPMQFDTYLEALDFKKDNDIDWRK